MEESEMIDSYLKGELEGEVMAAIESRINSDPSFRAKVELRRRLIDSIHSAYQDELKGKLKDLDRKIDRRAKLINTRYMIAASLAFIMVAVLGVYLYRNNSKYKFDKYDIFENGIPNTMGASDNSTFTTAMNYFKATQYSEALQLFEGITQTDTVNYYSGVSAYRIGNLNRAVQYFQRIEEGSEYFTKANYRLGLTYWKENHIDLAIPVLMKVTQDTSSEYSKNAKQILSKEF
jgi:hypothetical protein